MTPEQFDRLVAAGMTTDQIGVVMKMLAEETAALKAAEEARKLVARERVQKWRAKLGLSSSEWVDLRTVILNRDGYQCVYCGSTEEPLHVDHKMPLSLGGSNDPDNLVVACRECNCGKSGRTVEQWRAGK